MNVIFSINLNPIYEQCLNNTFIAITGTIRICCSIEKCTLFFLILVYVFKVRVGIKV